MSRLPLIVDAKTLRSIRHACDCCQNKSIDQCCCMEVEVCVADDEAERIIGLLPHVASYCPELDPDDVFEENEEGDTVLANQESGLCVFGYQRDGRILCALHSAALDLGLPWTKMKPHPCVLWPLALSEDDPPVLSVDPDHACFHCNTPNSGPDLDASMIGHLREAFEPEEVKVIVES